MLNNFQVYENSLAILDLCAWERNPDVGVGWRAGGWCWVACISE